MHLPHTSLIWIARHFKFGVDHGSENETFVLVFSEFSTFRTGNFDDCFDDDRFKITALPIHSAVVVDGRPDVREAFLTRVPKFDGSVKPEARNATSSLLD